MTCNAEKPRYGCLPDCMQDCRLTFQVDALKDLFKDDFKFETDYFEIPAERWQTSLLRKVSDFIWQYDSRDCLAIIYYGGHGYVGQETKSLKLSAYVL